MIGSATGARIGITGLGTNVPATVMTNDDLARFVDTSDEWIRERTGIRERRIASQDEALTDIALPAVREALAEAGAGKILASASHAVLSGNAVRNINASRIAQLIVTDSIEERPERKSDKIVVLPIGELMGKAIQNIHEEASITSLFI